MREQVSQGRRAGGRAGAIVGRFTTVPLGYIAAVVMMGLLGLTLIDVVLRAARGRGIDGVIEYTEVLLVIGVFISLAIAQADGSHIATSVVTSNVSRLSARVLNSLVGLVGAIVLAITIWATTERFLDSLVRSEYTMGVARVDLWPARLAVAVGLAIYLFEFVRTIVRGPSQRSLAEESQAEYELEEKRDDIG